MENKNMIFGANSNVAIIVKSQGPSSSELTGNHVQSRTHTKKKKKIKNDSVTILSRIRWLGKAYHSAQWYYLRLFAKVFLWNFQCCPCLFFCWCSYKLSLFLLKQIILGDTDLEGMWHFRKNSNFKIFFAVNLTFHEILLCRKVTFSGNFPSI